MPLSFLNPVYLWGALAALIPLALHFWRRRRARDVAFSDLRFLREVQANQARSLGVKRLLLLLLRMLILALIALAAAGPRFSGLAAGGGRVSLLILLDASASMQTRFGEADRFQAAMSQAVAMGKSLSAGSDVQILLTSSVRRPVFGSWTPSHLLRDVDPQLIRPDDSTLDLPGALRDAASWLARSRHRTREIVMLSDFQPAETDTAGLRRAVEALRIAGVQRMLLRRVGEPVSNGAILDLMPPLRALTPDEQVEIRISVQAQHEAQTFTMELDGVPVAQAVGNEAPGLRQELILPLTVPPPGRYTGLIRTTSDALTRDDLYPFVLDVPQVLRVLIVHRTDRSAGDTWRYLAGALSPDGAGLFAVSDIGVSELQDDDLDAADLVFLSDPGPLGSVRLESLQRWLRTGGRCVLLLGDPRDADYLADTLLPALDLGGDPRYRSCEPGGEQELDLLAGGRDLLTGFEAPALATLTRSLWRRYYALDAGESRVLIRFSGGDPVLMASDYGEGRLMLMPMNMSADATDFRYNPMALPFWRRLALHTAGGRAFPASRPAGDRVDLQLPRAPDRDYRNALFTLSYRDPGNPGSAYSRPVELGWRGLIPVLEGGVGASSGYYAFSAGRDTLGLVAVATPGRESIAMATDTDDQESQLMLAGLDRIYDLGGEDPSRLGDRLAGRDPLLLLVLLIILLMLLETGIARKA